MAMLQTVVLLLCIALAMGTNAKGKAYLEANKAKEGVIELPSGLQYKVLTSGSGKVRHPFLVLLCAGSLFFASTQSLWSGREVTA